MIEEYKHQEEENKRKAEEEEKLLGLLSLWTEYLQAENVKAVPTSNWQNSQFKKKKHKCELGDNKTMIHEQKQIQEYRTCIIVQQQN